MIRARCTAYVRDENDDRMRVCDREDDCARVITRSSSGKVLTDRMVCGACRKRMQLPDRDVVLGVGGPSLFTRLVKEERDRRKRGY